jgi:hypothetical protein
MLHAAQDVESIGLAQQVAEVAAQRHGLLVAGGRGPVVSGLMLHDAEAVQGIGLAVEVAEVAKQRQGLLLAGGGGCVAALLPPALRTGET